MKYSVKEISEMINVEQTCVRTVLGMSEFEKRRDENRTAKGFIYDLSDEELDNLKTIIFKRRKWKKLKEGAQNDNRI